MSSFAALRRIALLIVWLKTELKPPRRSKLSARDLAALLNAAQTTPPPFQFDGPSVSQLLHGHMPLDDREEALVLHALRELIRTHTNFEIDVQKKLPKWIEDQYATRLRDALREPPTGSVIQGEQFGDKAKFLEGAWRFFSVTMPNDAGEMKPQLLQFSILFLPPTSKSIELIMITKQRQWTGVAHTLGNHLYLHLCDSRETKTALLIMNLPVKQRLMISGAGVALEQASELASTPAVLGFVCFAEKWGKPSSGTSDVQATVDRLMRGDGDIAETDAGVLRSAFCKRYASADEFKKEHQTLSRYVQSHKFNGKMGAFLQALYVAYP
jgi:hypothetical protein